MSAQMFDSWDKDGEGRLKVWPLQAFTTAIFEDRVGFVRFEVGVPRTGLPSPAVQIALDAEQLRLLAAALTEAADRLEGLASGSPTPS